jgi:hypothetical protein
MVDFPYANTQQENAETLMSYDSKAEGLETDQRNLHESSIHKKMSEALGKSSESGSIGVKVVYTKLEGKTKV